MSEPNAPLRVLSLGGGQQSSGLYLMSCLGELPKLDAAIFADTQHEMPETYTYLDFLAGMGERAGIPLLTVTAGDLLQTFLDRRGRGSQPQLPVRVRSEDSPEVPGRIGAYTCSYNFKREQVTRAVKKMLGKPGAWKRPGAVEQWIGYSTDEASRMKQPDECWCGHKRGRRRTRAERKAEPERGEWEAIHTPAGCTRCACEGFAPWQRNVWPLIDPLRMRRGDVARWITDRGYPEPPRSACYFCPNRGNAHWRELRDNRPELWVQAVRLDEAVRHGCNGLRGTAYLHASAVPLTEADLRPKYEQVADATGQEPLFTDEVDTDCDAGVCFT